jgi:hypothetical protein
MLGAELLWSEREDKNGTRDGDIRSQILFKCSVSSGNRLNRLSKQAPLVPGDITRCRERPGCAGAMVSPAGLQVFSKNKDLRCLIGPFPRIESLRKSAELSNRTDPPPGLKKAPVSGCLAAIETGAETTGEQAQRHEPDTSIYPARAIGDVAQDVLRWLVAQGVRPAMVSTVAGLAFGGDA